MSQLVVSKAKVGQVLNLTKTVPGVNIQEIGLSWNQNTTKSKGKEVDVDIFAIISDMDGKNAQQSGVFFYNSIDGKDLASTDAYPESMSHADMLIKARELAKTSVVIISRDNRTGAGDGDDEIVFINRSLIPEGKKITIGMNIHEADDRKQDFTMVDDCQVNVYAEDKSVAINYDLGVEFSTDQGILVAELFMFKGEPQFKAIGQAFKGDVNDFFNLFQ